MNTQRNGHAQRNSADGMGGVGAPKQYGYLGDIRNVSPNTMYWRYVKWMKAHRGGKKVLSFGHWMNWAKAKGLIGNKAFNWDGTETLGVGEDFLAGNIPTSEEPVNVEDPQEVSMPKVEKDLKKVDLKLQRAMLWLAAITTTIAIIGFATRK